MEPSIAIQILGVIVETYAGVLAIGSGFFTFLIQRHQERMEREDERIREERDDVETLDRLNRIGREMRGAYRFFLGFVILCFVVIILSFIIMGIAESTPQNILNYEVWFIEGLASTGFIYIAVFAWSLLH